MLKIIDYWKSGKFISISSGNGIVIVSKIEQENEVPLIANSKWLFMKNRKSSLKYDFFSYETFFCFVIENHLLLEEREAYFELIWQWYYLCV